MWRDVILIAFIVFLLLFIIPIYVGMLSRLQMRGWLSVLSKFGILPTTNKEKAHGNKTTTGKTEEEESVER